MEVPMENDCLRDVKSWMAFYGWTDGGSPGAVKRDADGKEIARHGDAIWIADVEEACAAIEREQIKAEIERRERLGFPVT
jgi:hypothetical protein